VFHCVLQSLCYNLANIHKITPNIHEVIAFTKWLGVKQTAKCATCEVWVVCAYLDPWNKYFSSSKFYVNLHTCIPCHQEQFSLLRVGSKSAPINSEKSMTELNGPHFSEFGRPRIQL
jgi:hypothetical protein